MTPCTSGLRSLRDAALREPTRHGNDVLSTTWFDAVTILLVEPTPWASNQALALSARRGISIVGADDLEELQMALGAWSRGVVVIGRSVIGRARQLPDLSERAEAALRLLVAGATTTEIGARLFLSESSTKRVLNELKSQMGVRTRDDLARAGRALGFTEASSSTVQAIS